MNKIIDTIDKDTIKKLNLHLGEAMDTGYAKLHFNEISNLIDLYETQQAENKELKTDKIIAERKEKDARELFKNAVLQIEQAKIEAIKEFAEKYKKVLLSMLTTATLEKKEVIYSCLDTLEEMVGKK